MANDMLGLENKNALVIGGGGGFQGGHTSRRLAEAGCNVAIADASLEGAQNVAAEVEQLGRQASAYHCDVLDAAGIERLVTQVDEEMGGLDVLVLIVGQPHWTTLADMSLDVWDYDLNFNLKYVFAASRTAAMAMAKRGRGGAITCITSISGVRAAPSHAAYGAAKAGLIHLVKSMANEWGKYNIRVNSVAPGTIFSSRVVDSPELREQARVSTIPLKRRGFPDEIAKAITFLSSDMASYVTGQTLMVDGGWGTAPERLGMRADAERKSLDGDMAAWDQA